MVLQDLVGLEQVVAVLALDRLKYKFDIVLTLSRVRFDDGPQTSLERLPSNRRQFCQDPVIRQKVNDYTYILKHKSSCEKTNCLKTIVQGYSKTAKLGRLNRASLIKFNLGLAVL